MADVPAETPQFETDEVSATRGREQGLGVGARELDAQRDSGGVRTENDPAEDEVQIVDGDQVFDRDTAIQGASER